MSSPHQTFPSAFRIGSYQIVPEVQMASHSDRHRSERCYAPSENVNNMVAEMRSNSLSFLLVGDRQFTLRK